MAHTCEQFSELIARSFFDDLESPERQELERHLLDCSRCRQERAALKETLSELERVREVSLPRHFLVHEDVGSTGIKGFLLQAGAAFRGLRLPHRLAAAATFCLVVLLLGFALAQTQVSMADGTLSIRFGTLKSSQISASQKEAMVRQIRDEMRQEFEQRLSAEHDRWLAEVNKDLSQSEARMLQAQQQLLESRNVALQNWVDDQMGTQRQLTDQQFRQSLASFYSGMEERYARRFADLIEHVESLSTRGELQNRETNQLLATLVRAVRLDQR